MTSVTETAKRLGDGLDLSDLHDADLRTICDDPLLAAQFARALTERARELWPHRQWSAEDLRDLLDAAVRRRDVGVRIVEGRYFRKRLREQCGLAERYGDTFAVLVVSLSPEPQPGIYQSVLDAIVERLRQTDMVFLYRRRFALVLPRMGSETVPPMVERVRELIAVGAGDGVVEGIEWLVYPGDRHHDTQSVLDWAEDQLRPTP